MIDEKILNPNIELCCLEKNGEPFPTMFWLKKGTDLHRNISDLESKGYIKLFEQWLAQNEKALNLHTQSQQEYSTLRWQLACKSIDMSNWSDPLKNRLKHTGFGGIADFKRVRCFHMFYAGHLYKKNITGEFIDNCFKSNKSLDFKDHIGEFESKLNLK